MRKSLFLFLALSLVPSAFAQNSAAVKKALEEQLAKYQQAVRRKDLPGAMSIFDAKFEMILPNGQRQSSQDAARELKTFIDETVRLDDWKMVLGPVKTDGKTATVQVDESFTRVFTTPKGSTQAKFESSRLVDTWVKTPKGWRIRQIQMKSHGVLRDLGPARAMLEESYAKYGGGIRSRNVEAAVLVWDRDYAEELISGQLLNRYQAKAQLASVMKGTTGPIEYRTAFVKDKNGTPVIDLKDDRLRVQRTEVVKLTVKGASGKKIPQEIRQTLLDTWVKNSKGWFWSYSKCLVYSTTVNGKTTTRKRPQ